MDFTVCGILLDIEGTTSSVSFVYDVMFPFVRRELAGFLADQWNDGSVEAACDQVAHDAGYDGLSSWCGAEASLESQQEAVRVEVLRLMDNDVKATGLKSLQGLIWRSGFESGELVAHVYEDVVPAITAWRKQRLDVRIYSSGSVTAQQLFFRYTQQGNLLPLFSAHYDTCIGSKKDVNSYSKIAADCHVDACQILFLSDVLTELDAARTAGMQTGLCVRPGNAEVQEAHNHPEFQSFDELTFRKKS